MNDHASPSPSTGEGFPHPPSPLTGEDWDGGADADDGGRPATRRLPANGEEVLNLDWITPHLAVGGAFDDEVERLAELGIRAVVDLRSEARDDEAQLGRCGIGLLHLPTEDHRAVNQAMLDQGVAFTLDHLQHGRRVLIHCREGIGRSVTLALCVMCVLGREPLSAMTEIKDRRACASPSPVQFEAWAAWLRGRSMTAPPFDDFAAIAYRHLKRG